MTLDEARKEIEDLFEKKWKEYKATGSQIAFGESMALDDALSILAEVE